MTITVTFDPPLPSDSPAVFNSKAFTLLGDLNDWSTEANTTASDINTDKDALLAAGLATVSANIANVSAVGTNIAKVTAVADDLAEPVSEIATVADNIANVNTVGSGIANVNSVAGSISNVNTVATNIAGVNTTATNIAAVLDAPTQASNAAASASAALTSANNAANSASAASTSANSAANSANQAAASAASANAIVLGVASGYPTINPSLNLDFANTRTLDPRITFIRATTATYYDGKTVAKAEENLLLQSQTFDNEAWTQTFTSVTANSTTAPDGTTTADAEAETGVTQFFAFTQPVAIMSGLIYTWSVFLKKGNGATAPDIMQLTFKAATFSSAYANFNISAGTVGTTSGCTAAIANAGNGWYRCSITATAVATDSVSNVQVAFTNNNDALGRSPTYAGATTSNVFLWGAQLEQRSTVTAYTPTTTQPITNYIPVLQTAAENVARFDHNPVTGESLGLLVEEQRTNLLLRSAEFDNASWIKSASIVSANVVVSPEGTVSAEKLVADSSNVNSHSFTQNISFTSGVTYTLTVYAKAGEYGYANLVLPSAAFGTNQIGTFDLLTGASTVSVGAPTVSITFVGNGWYRCAITETQTATTTGDSCIRLNSNYSNAAYSGNGFSGIYIWGAQLEAGSFPTSYIPTAASQATRNADAASMTGANFSSWYRQDEGALFAEWAKIGPSTFQAVAIASDGTGSNVVAMGHGSIFGSNNNLRLDVTTGGVSQASMTTITGSLSSTFYKTSGTYKVNDFAVVTNGGSVATDTAGTVPVVNRLSIGSSATVNTNFLNGHIRTIRYYPQRLTNSQLQAITS